MGDTSEHVEKESSTRRRLRIGVLLAAYAFAWFEVICFLAMFVNRQMLIRAAQSETVLVLVGMLTAMLAYRLFRALRQYRQQC